MVRESSIVGGVGICLECWTGVGISGSGAFRGGGGLSIKLRPGIDVAPFLVEDQCAVSRYVARDGSVVNYWKTAMCGRC